MNESYKKREEWRTIPEFPRYQVSNKGQIYNNLYEHMMRVSRNNYGHVKITLTDEDGSRHTRSVAQIVAEAFVKPDSILCDQVVVLDGDFSNVTADNLVWRPRWFAWKYTHQLKIPQPMYYHNLPVINIIDEIVYDSIIHAATTEGLLLEDIWRSTYTGAAIFPTGSIFEVAA